MLGDFQQISLAFGNLETLTITLSKVLHNGVK